MKTNKLKVLLLPIIVLMMTLLTTEVDATGFNVTREITGVTNTVSNQFTYHVVADASNPGTVTPPANTTLTVSGTPSNNKVSTDATPLYADSAFTGLTYPQPGTYKFIVSESASANATVYPIDTTTYTVTVYVTNVLDNGVPTGALQATYIGSQKNGTGSKITGADSDKAIFTSGAGMSKITVNNTYKGNLANTNEYCKYTVTINGLPASGVLTISGLDSSGVTYNGAAVTNPTSVTANGSGVATAVIYLNHEDTATIGSNGSLNEIPVGVTYSVAQESITTFDSTTVNGTSGSSTGSKTVSASANNNKAEFINTLGVIPPTPDPNVPTGLIIRLFPFVLLLVISAVGIVLIRRTKTKEEN